MPGVTPSLSLTVSTKAEVRFHVQTADWIPEDVRQKVLEKVCCQNKSLDLLISAEAFFFIYMQRDEGASRPAVC